MPKSIAIGSLAPKPSPATVTLLPTVPKVGVTKIILGKIKKVVSAVL